MNIKKRLIHLAEYSGKDRRLGRTPLLMKVAKDLDAVVIAANVDQAKMLERQFGVVAKSVEINLEGLSGPFIFDHFAVETMFLKAANKIEVVEKENQELKDEVRTLKKELGMEDA